MQDNRIYLIPQVAECKTAAEIFYLAPSTTTLYQNSCRTSLSATMCSVKVDVIPFNCGLFSHCSIAHVRNTITYELIVTPEMCKAAST